MNIIHIIKNALPALLISTTFATAETKAAAAKSTHSPIGYWLTGIDEEVGKRRAKVELYPCGSKICGKILALSIPIDPETKKPKLDKHNPDASKQSRPVVGMQMVSNMAPDASEPNKWGGGTLYDAVSGNTYSGYFIMPDNNNLHLTGTVLGGLIGRTQEWIRTTKDGGF